MNFEENIHLEEYTYSAEQTFTALSSRLKTVENDLDTQIGGRSRAGLVFAYVGTGIWLVVYGIMCGFASNLISDSLLTGVSLCCAAMVLLLLIDDLLASHYYGKLLRCQSQIQALSSQLKMGSASMGANTRDFLDSQSTGWDFAFPSSRSIPQTVETIELRLSKIRKVKHSFFGPIKNFFYYITAIFITIAGGSALSQKAGEIINNISEFGLSMKTLDTVIVIAIVISCIAEFIFAKFIWARFECNVTNGTLLATLTGPMVFLVLIFVGTLVATLVAGVLYIAFQILIGVVAVGILAASSSGG